MSQIQSLVNHVRQLIGENDLKAALNELQRFLIDSPKLDEMLMHSARFQDVLKHIHLGTLDFDKATITKNHINKGVLELLREIEERGSTTHFQIETLQNSTIKEDTHEYNTIKAKIFLNRGAGTAELLKDKNTDDLDEKELNRFFVMERVIQSFDEDELTMSELTFQKRLIYLGLAENGHIFKGTFLCLGKRNQIQTISHSATEAKFIIFKGTNRAHIALLETLNGNIIRQFEKMMMLLRLHIPLGRDREKSEDIYEIPMLAIREFIANAFVHRDYSDTVQSYIQVEMYDDRLEIKSPGHLPPNVNVNKIEGTILINPTIAAVFHLYKFIERAGTGINISQLSLQQQGLKPATIENVDNPKMVKVTIYREKVIHRADEDAFWQEVTTKNTALMYNRYLRKYPQGRYATEADKRLDELENQ